jgi:hypothetical protein
VKARKKKRAQPDLFYGKGTELRVRVDADLLKHIDALRSDVNQRTGIETTRQQVLEGLLRKVWHARLVEASVLGVGSKIGGGS